MSVTGAGLRPETAGDTAGGGRLAQAARGVVAILLVLAWVAAHEYLVRLDPIFVQWSPHGAAGLLLYVTGHERQAAHAYRRHFERFVSRGGTTGDEGVDAILAGDLARAERFVSAQPGSPSAALTRAEIALDRGAPPTAVALLEARLADAPDDLDALTLLSIARARAGDADRAIEPIGRVLRLDRIGGRLTGLLRILEATGELRARGQQPLCLIAEYYRYLRVFDPSNARPARRYAEAAIARDDHAAEAYVVLGAIHEKQGRLDAALAAFEQATVRSPADPEPYRRAALIHSAHGDLGREYAMIRRAFDLRPTDAVYIKHLSNLLTERLGDVATEVAAMERVLERDPGNALAEENLALAYSTLGDARRALDHFHRLAAREPTEPQYLENIGWALRQLGREEEAVAFYRRAAAMAPRRPQPHAALANIHARHRRPAEAVAEYQTAVALGDHAPATVRSLCIAYFRASQFADATVCLESVLAVTPGDTTAQRFLGQARINAALQRERRS
jgi:tetratricopeptide (TPR) repeat protein